MTDHDDAPSTEERERARAELTREGKYTDWAANVDIVDERVRANRLAARCASSLTELAYFREACRQYGVEENAGPDGVGKIQRRREYWEGEAERLAARVAELENVGGWRAKMGERLAESQAAVERLAA